MSPFDGTLDDARAFLAERGIDVDPVEDQTTALRAELKARGWEVELNPGKQGYDARVTKKRLVPSSGLPTGSDTLNTVNAPDSPAALTFALVDAIRFDEGRH